MFWEVRIGAVCNHSLSRCALIDGDKITRSFRKRPPFARGYLIDYGRLVSLILPATVLEASARVFRLSGRRESVVFYPRSPAPGRARKRITTFELRGNPAATGQGDRKIHQTREFMMIILFFIFLSLTALGNRFWTLSLLTSPSISTSAGNFRFFNRLVKPASWVVFSDSIL